MSESTTTIFIDINIITCLIEESNYVGTEESSYVTWKKEGKTNLFMFYWTQKIYFVMISDI